MEICLIQQVFAKGKANDFQKVYKKYESDTIPHKGDFISDTAYKDKQEVVEVTIDYNYNKCYIMLSVIELDPIEQYVVNSYIEMMKSHSWHEHLNSSP